MHLVVRLKVDLQLRKLGFPDTLGVLPLVGIVAHIWVGSSNPRKASMVY